MAKTHESAFLSIQAFSCAVGILVSRWDCSRDGFPFGSAAGFLLSVINTRAGQPADGLGGGQVTATAPIMAYR
jgi:hypothetical protein